jgi:hypothetical protein
MFSGSYLEYYLLGVILIPGILLALYAQIKTTSTFKKYSKVKTAAGYTGKQMAEKILQEEGIDDVVVVESSGFLSDHYSHKDKKIALSPEVYSGTSVSALGVAAHEVGHAIQYKKGYIPVHIRSFLVPLTGAINTFLWPLVFIGLIFGLGSSFDSPLGTAFIYMGLIFFSSTVVFSLITLPVEFNASRRAISSLEGSYMLDSSEIKGSKKVLNAAALTYVAGLLIAVLNLLRFIILTNRD